jgi:hypothetical protein
MTQNFLGVILNTSFVDMSSDVPVWNLRVTIITISDLRDEGNSLARHNLQRIFFGHRHVESFGCTQMTETFRLPTKIMY